MGLLSKETSKEIPSSTRHNWKERNLDNLFGFELEIPEDNKLELLKTLYKNKLFLHAAKAVFRINQIQQRIISSFGSYKKHIYNSKDDFLKIIERYRKSLSFDHIIKYAGITKGQFQYWKKKIKDCASSPFSLCRPIFPNQLTIPEIKTIACYMKKEEYRTWPSNSVYFQALRDSAIFISLSTWYRYVGALKLERQKGYSRKKKHKVGIRADKPGKIIHMDMLIFRPLNHLRVYIYVIVDNFSRAILGAKASYDYSAKVAFENLYNAVRNYNLLKKGFGINLITDDGSENRGEVDDFITNPGVAIKKIVAQKDIIESNSMVEAANKKLEYQYLYHKDLRDLEDTCEFLDEAVDDFNNRPAGIHFGLTPLEVFNGRKPDRTIYRQDILRAKKERILYNQEFNCEECVDFKDINEQ